MRNGLKLLFVFVTLVVLAPVAVVAQSPAVRTMAGILLTLNHFPDDAAKKALQAIVDDEKATAHERTVAEALLNVQHRVSSDDKAKLEAVLEDEAAPEDVKTLAASLVGLEHTATDAAKANLKKLVS